MRRILSTLTIITTLTLASIGLSHAQDDEFALKARAWLLSDPEVLLEAMEILQDQQVAQQTSIDVQKIAANSTALFENEDNGFYGDAGEVIGVEFLDYQCGYCKRQLEAVKEFNLAHPNQRIIIKEFPILGPMSEVAARVALATKVLSGNNVYLQVHNKLLEHQGRLTNEVIDQILVHAGMDVKNVRAAMSDPLITEQIEDTRALATQLGVQGTPGWVFKDEIARGLVTADILRSKVKN